MLYRQHECFTLFVDRFLLANPGTPNCCNMQRYSATNKLWRMFDAVEGNTGCYFPKYFDGSSRRYIYMYRARLASMSAGWYHLSSGLQHAFDSSCIRSVMLSLYWWDLFGSDAVDLNIEVCMFQLYIIGHLPTNIRRINLYQPYIRCRTMSNAKLLLLVTNSVCTYVWAFPFIWTVACPTSWFAQIPWWCGFPQKGQ